VRECLTVRRKAATYIMGARLGTSVTFAWDWGGAKFVGTRRPVLFHREPWNTGWNTE
jgi:hypothetical protein